MADNTSKPAAVLGDLNAIFHASKDIDATKDVAEATQLNFVALKLAIVKHFKMGDTRDMFTLWSSSEASNEGQERLLTFLERNGFTIRRFAPRDSFIFEPEKLALDRKMLLLQRFSGGIAFAAGVICKSHRIILISDSFELAEPLVRASKLGGDHDKSGIAFWGSRLDPRWPPLIDRFKIDFLDLDTIEKDLFRTKTGGAGKMRRFAPGFDDDFLIDMP